MNPALAERPANTFPEYDVDFYSDAFLADPYLHYRTMRDLGPAVWMRQNDCWAITRFADVQGALRNADVFSSARGVMMNDHVNQGASGSILCTDDPDHRRLRRKMAKPLLPPAVAQLRPQMEALADAQIRELVQRGRFDGVADFAHFLPLMLVTRLVGLPEDGQGQMLEWAGAIFNACGPLNDRGRAGLGGRGAALAYLQSVPPERMKEGSLGHRLFEQVEEGEITDSEARQLLLDYVAPALDTTINATSGALLLFGRNPEQWDAVRADPSLLSGAMDEAMRLETPIRAFSRYVTREHPMEDLALPAGARVLLVYASANRDERRWPDAEKFDVRRKAHEQLSFGTGDHMCVGMHLAKAEMQCMFGALARHVARFEVGEPERTPHNLLRGIDGFDVRIIESAHD